MGLLDFLKRNRKQKEIRSIISNYYGGDWKFFVWNYAQNIAEIPEVKIACEKVSDIMSAVPIWHKRINKNGSIDYLEDATARVLTYQPNPLQNGSQFIKNLITDLLINGKLMTFVHGDSETGASMVLVSATKGGAEGMKLLPPLLLHESGGNTAGARPMTARAEKIYETMSFEET